MIPPLCTDRWANLETHAMALDEFCPRCAAGPGEICVGTISGEPMKACHWQRVRLALGRQDACAEE